MEKRDLTLLGIYFSPICNFWKSQGFFYCLMSSDEMYMANTVR